MCLKLVYKISTAVRLARGQARTGPEHSGAGPEPSGAGPEPSGAGPRPSGARRRPSGARRRPPSTRPTITRPGPSTSRAGPGPSDARPEGRVPRGEEISERFKDLIMNRREGLKNMYGETEDELNKSLEMPIKRGEEMARKLVTEMGCSRKVAIDLTVLTLYDVAILICMFRC